jgi:hypothetical protein
MSSMPEVEDQMDSSCWAYSPLQAGEEEAQNLGIPKLPSTLSHPLIWPDLSFPACGLMEVGGGRHSRRLGCEWPRTL